MLISYARNFEDVMLMRAVGHVRGGFYIDVGAQHPVHDSVSQAFYERGWRGVHVEPEPEHAQRLREARPGERVIQAVVDGRAEPMMFYAIPGTGLSTGDPEIAKRHLEQGFDVRTILAQTMPLSQLLEAAGNTDIHWLKINVQGMEKSVLDSWGDCQARPWVLVVGGADPHSPAAHGEWASLVERRGYELVYFDGLNRYYVSADHPELMPSFSTPPNPLDDFSLTENSVFTRASLGRLRRVEAERDRQKAKSEQLKRQVDAAQESQGRLDAKYKDLLRQLTSAEQTRRDLAAAQASADDAYHTLAALRASHSWKITAPIRGITTLTRRLMLGVSAWVLFRPGSRPHRVARRLFGLEGRDAAQLAPPAVSGRPELVFDTAVRLVFVDHTIACQTNTGVQRVVRGLSKSLLESGVEVRFVKWSDEAEACVLIDAEERAYLGRWNGPAMAAAEAGLYPPRGARTPSVAAAANAGGRLIVPEVTHMATHPRPITARLIAWAKGANLETGFIFYDAIPLRRPEFAATAPVHAQYMRDLRMADAIWPISRWSADQLVSFWGMGADADSGGRPAVQPILLPAAFDRPRTLAAKPGEKLILSVGTLEPRKNQLTLIKAFQDIQAERPRSGWRLVLTGNLHPVVAEAVRAATGPGSCIEFLGHVSDADLSTLYEQCAFTVFPSVDEGFGLPIIESLWQGKPCICADFGAMGEVAEGGGCVAVDVRDSSRLKSAIEHLMDDPDALQTLADQAVARKMPSWQDYISALEGSNLIYYWVDSTIVTPVNTGIQRVVRQLARALIDAGFRLVPVKWGGMDDPFRPVSDEELAHFARWNGPAVDHWHAWVSPRDRGAGGRFLITELPLHLTDAEQQAVRGTAEAAGLKTAAVFYDTIPWKMRHIYPENFATAHRLYIRELANYDVIMPISHYSGQEFSSVLAEEFGLPEPGAEQLVVCSLPAEFPERTGETATRRHAAGVVQVLAVGTVEPRKNHERLLDAFEIACRTSATPLHLTIVGGGLSIEPQLAVRVRARVDASPHMTWEEKADDTLVKQLYAQCDFTVYPSIEEGFGLPILESLWEGKPCICASFGAMLEVAADGGGCVTVDVKDVDALAKAIRDLAEDAGRREVLAQETQVRRFRSWSDYASDVAHGLGLWPPPGPQALLAHRQSMGLHPPEQLQA